MKRVEFLEAKNRIKHPQKIAFAVCKDRAGKFNVIVLEWFMRTSIQPPMFAISIGKTRYSCECLQENRFFNLAFPSVQMKAAAKICGTKSGRDFDKFLECDIRHFPGRLAKYPILRDAAANFECRVVTQVRSGDHIIFVGEVKNSWINENDLAVLTYQDFEKK